MLSVAALVTILVNSSSKHGNIVLTLASPSGIDTLHGLEEFKVIETLMQTRKCLFY